jgi:hypothetical protein
MRTYSSSPWLTMAHHGSPWLNNEMCDQLRVLHVVFFGLFSPNSFSYGKVLARLFGFYCNWGFRHQQARCLRQVKFVEPSWGIIPLDQKCAIGNIFSHTGFLLFRQS